MKFRRASALWLAWVVGSSAAAQPGSPSCGAPCGDCAGKLAGNGGSISVSLQSVEFDGFVTAFTYQVCQDQESRDLSHWALEVHPLACDRLVEAVGGTAPFLGCGPDPTTNVFGVKFETKGGVPFCDGTSCAGGGALFILTFAGNIGAGCVTAVGKIGGGESLAYGCLRGAVIKCQTDSDCDDGDPCTGTETCGENLTCNPVADIVDCNTNGFADDCDIADGTSRDCDGNGVPDECEPSADCNGNGIRDSCDIAAGTSGDCNENEVPDECEPESDCNGNGQQDICDLADGTSPDCNGNGVPDECDIFACDDLPACDDCNLNRVPDGCDIDTGGSLDVDPADGIPDECVDPASDGGDWTDDIWDLADENPKNPFPDNEDGVDNLHVTIKGFSVFLDETVEVQTLRLLNAGTLLVTQDTFGDFATVAAGGILNEGSLLVGNNRRIVVDGGDMTIGPGGLYGLAVDADATGCPSSAVCASLSARNLTILRGDCDTPFGGELNLDQALTVVLTGDLTLSGVELAGCSAGAAALVQGINPPPKFRVTGPGGITLEGTFNQDGFAESFNTTPAGELAAGRKQASQASFQGVTLGGDFANHAIAPSLFDWVTGTLTMNGQDQLFEVAGIDLGPSVEGFLTDRDTLFDTDTHQNYSIGTVEIVSGSHVTFVNEFANTVGAGACQEAFYVKRLILQAGSAMTLDNVNVYYESLEDNGATIDTIGECGGLLGLCNPAVPTTDSSVKNRFITITTGVPGRLQAIRVTFEDLPPPFDALNGVIMWAGQPFAVTEDTSSVEPQPGVPNFMASKLQCEPFFTDWSAVGTVEMYHAAIVPAGSYPIQIIDQTCAAGFDDDFSAPLAINMARFGDIVGSCETEPCSPPNGYVDIQDLLSVVNTFAPRPGRVSKVRADIEPAEPDLVINISDAMHVINAFNGLSYSFPVPEIPCAD